MWGWRGASVATGTFYLICLGLGADLGSLAAKITAPAPPDDFCAVFLVLVLELQAVVPLAIFSRGQVANPFSPRFGVVAAINPKIC